MDQEDYTTLQKCKYMLIAYNATICYSRTITMTSEIILIHSDRSLRSQHHSISPSL